MQSSAGDRESSRSLRLFGLDLKSVLRLVLVGVLLATLSRLLLWQVYTVSGESMAPTLTSGERIVVFKPSALSAPQVGDIVVIDGRDTLAVGDVPDPAWLQTLLVAESLDTRLFVKRVAAVGGDHLVCCDATGSLVRNGQPVNEPYLNGGASDFPFDVTVPAGHVFVLGDNREHSLDSRDLLGRPSGGMIASGQIVGRVDAVVWPPARMSLTD